VNVLGGLDFGVIMSDHIIRSVIHTVGSRFVNGTGLYYWEDSLKTGEELIVVIQEEPNAWG
jgi:hypothetical protein